MPKLTVEGVGSFDVPEGKRLVLALEDEAGIGQLHACGGNARCTTCRVEFVEGEPDRMTVAEKTVLNARGLSGVRLSCQIPCDHDMSVRAISRLAGSGRSDAGNKPLPDIQPQPVESDWAELREAQMLAIDTLPNVGVACITDIGAATDIHPKDKQNVGKRLARLAFVNDYKLPGVTKQGPTYRSIDIHHDRIVVHFDTYGQKLTGYYNEPLTGFAIAGNDKKWVWGNAKITGDDSVSFGALALATVVAFVFGYISIAFLLRWLTTHSMMIFVIYRIVLGAAVLALAGAGTIS